MGKINLLISGNLTGFSRLYTSPDANEIYKEAKFDFDYRNFLRFHKVQYKAYTIAFSSKVIAISIVTNILDSFNRPGILVISILMQRNETVVHKINQSDTSAIYQLLNRINDKFYEKNFQKGVMNQNPYVLQEDHYSDILQEYTTIHNPQPFISGAVDPAAAVRKAGYVEPAQESDIPLYLATPCRASYEGYHLIFFTKGSPSNIIPEPVKEIKRYTVKVSNTGQIISSVLLTDKISASIQTKEWEEPCNMDYTYEQALKGRAGSDILAIDEGNDRLTLTYKFKNKTKTLRFRFQKNGEDIDFNKIEPILVINGQRRNVRAGSYTFEGEETVSRVTIQCGSPVFSISSNNNTIDIRLRSDKEEVTIPVYSCFQYRIDFAENSCKAKSIRFLNSAMGQQDNAHQITDSITFKLAGDPKDWRIEISSNAYENYSCTLSSIKEAIRLKEKTILVPTLNPVRVKPQPIEPDQPAPTPKRGLVWQQWAAICICTVIIGVLGWILARGGKENPVIKPIDKGFVFRFQDCNNKQLKLNDYSQWLENNTISIRLDYDTTSFKIESQKENTSNNNRLSIENHIIALPQCSKMIKVLFQVDGEDIPTNILSKDNRIYYSNLWSDTNEKINYINVSLNIKQSDLLLYLHLKKAVKEGIVLDSDTIVRYREKVDSLKYLKRKMYKLIEDLNIISNVGLKNNEVNKPSNEDLYNKKTASKIITITFDENGNWKTTTAEEMKVASNGHKTKVIAMSKALAKIKNFAESEEKEVPTKDDFYKDLGPKAQKIYDVCCSLTDETKNDYIEILKKECINEYTFENIQKANKKYQKK